MRISDWSSDVCSSDLKSSQPQQAEGMLNVCCQDSRLLRLSSSPDSQSNMPPPLGGGASCAKATFENAKNVLIKSSRWKITRFTRPPLHQEFAEDRKSTRLNSSH